MSLSQVLWRCWVVCSTPHALSPDALGPRTLSPRILSPHALSTNVLRNILNNQALQAEFFYGSLSKTMLIASLI